VRIRTAISMLAVAAVLAVAAPAFAQEKGAANVAFGYSNLTFFDPTDSVPTGWNAAIGVGVSPSAAIVGEVGGHYESGGKFHTFQGGAKFFGGGSDTMKPFFQVVTGLGHFNGGGGNAWLLTPGAGVDAKINDKASVRVQGDWVFARQSGVNANGIRIGAGIVINMPKK